MGGVLLGVSSARSAPRIALEQVYTFAGAHLRHETFTLEIPVRNTGDEPLDIKSVTTDCGCVSARAVQTVLPPGKASDLVVTVETRDFKGRVRRTVRIRSNDPDKPMAHAVIEYDVTGPLTIPPRVNLGVVRPGQRLVKRIPVTFRGEGHVRLLGARADNPGVQVRLPEKEPEKELRAGKKPVELTVTVNVPEKVGPFRSKVKIRTDREGQPELTTTITGLISNDVTVSTGTLDLGTITGLDSAEAVLEIACEPQTQIKAVTTTSKALQVWCEDTAASGMRIRVKPTHRMRIGTLSASVRIETTGRETQTIHIPVTATVVGR